jgi:hypothetical protein
MLSCEHQIYQQEREAKREETAWNASQVQVIPVRHRQPKTVHSALVPQRDNVLRYINYLEWSDLIMALVFAPGLSKVNKFLLRCGIFFALQHGAD